METSILKSYLTHLECSACGRTQSADSIANTCNSCGKILFVKYDIASLKCDLLKEVLATRPPNMWRYFELLPVRNPEHIVSLGEGYTPILPLEQIGENIGVNNLLMKDEGINPTGSFKVRGLSAAVSKAHELGIKKMTLPTAGNAGGALAVYAAKAGMDAHVFMPKDAPVTNMKEVRISGARLTLVDGLISDAGKLSKSLSDTHGYFDVSTLKEPYRAEGKKTMGYEIAEQMDWSIPDAIIYPTGGGTGIVGIWKAFQEMEELGWIDGKRPRMFSVQAENCAPIVKAFSEGSKYAEPWENASTIASGLRVPSPFADYIILEILRESGGGAVAVSDKSLMDDVRLAATLDGVLMCPEGAATISAARKLLSEGELSPNDTVLLLNTGSTTKYFELIA